MKIINLFLLLIFFVNSTQIKKNNLFLDRKKRFLSFPKGTNFVINLTLVKSLLRDSPPVNVLLECDVPFPLPSKEDYLRKKHDNIPLHFRQRRQIYLQLEDAFITLRVDGFSCLQRFLCEVDIQTKIHLHDYSLVIDILRVVFDLKDFEKYYGNHFENRCSEETFEKCEVSFLDLFLKSLRTLR